MIFGMEQFADRIAMQADDGTALLYSDVVDQIDRFSSHLENQRDVALCLCENSIECVIGYLSFLNEGIVPIMLGAQIEQAFILNYIDEYCPRYIWKPKSLKSEASGFEKVLEQGDYELLISTFRKEGELHRDLAVLATTSGSTGSRKLVRQSRKNILENTGGIVESLGLHKDTSTITTLPINYTFGMSVIHAHLSVGSTVHLTRHSIMQKQFWERFKAQQVNFLYGVPFTFEMLKKLKINRLDLPHLRGLAQAGGKLAPDICDFFSTWCEATQKRFYIMYGQAEATTRISCFCTSDYPEKTASVGKPLRGGCVEIKNNAAIGTDEPIEGEIVYRGNNVCMGYALARKDLKNGDDWNGELGTGDIGFVDEDGFLFITGRKKRIVKLYGHSVSLDDIEKQLNTSSSARFSCIADGEKVVVFHERLEIEGLQASLAKLFKLQPKDFQFIKIDATPRTDNGKVNYHSLEKMVHSSD